MGRRHLFRHRPHPGIMGLYVISWGIAVYSLHAVLAQAVLLALVLMVLSMTSRDGRGGLRLLAWSMPMMLLYAMVNSLFGIADGPLIWRGPHIPALGTLTISLGSIRDSLLRTLRMWDLLTFLIVIMHQVHSDDISYWLGRRFASVTLTLSMILNFMPNLLAERHGVSDMVMFRGAVDIATSRRTRLRAHAVVYQTLLMNALERSWTLAESMHVRGYGNGQRTNYWKPMWYRVDLWTGFALVVITCADVAWYFIGRIHGNSWGGLRPGDWLIVMLQVVSMQWLGVRMRAQRAHRRAHIYISRSNAPSD